MDYTKVPRSLIYKERDDLKDFGVQTPGTMNYLLFLHLKQQALMGVSGAREVALRCYNNAYYVCTLILLEANEFPELRISDYVDKILEIEKGKRHVDEVCLASMAMACQLLAKYVPQKYGTDSDIWKNINYRCTHYQWYHSSATTIFHNMMSGGYSYTSPLSHTEFDPRDIIEVIENCSEGDLQVFVEYICERLALLKDPRQQMYGADTAIARIKDYQHEFCEDSGYNPKKDRFKYEDNAGFVSDPIWEKKVRDYYQQGNEAIDYYTKYYPAKDEENDSNDNTVETPQAPETEAPQTKIEEVDSSQTESSKSETVQLQARIKELEDALDKEKAKNAKLTEEIAVLCEPVKELTATQNVRMAFALQLFRAAGLKDEKLDKRNRKLIKVAQLMMLLLDIRSGKKNNPAHTCAKWLSHREYVTSANKELIIDINKLFTELDWEIVISLENPNV